MIIAFPNELFEGKKIVFSHDVILPELFNLIVT